MNAHPPTDPEQLRRDLGISASQLEKLRASDKYKTEAKLIKALQKWWRETRDEPNLMGKTGGVVHSSAGALRVVQLQVDGRPEDSGEMVDELTQRRFTAEARQRDREAAQELALAAEDVRAALKARIDDSPNLRKMAGRSYYRISAELDRMVKNAKRRAA